MNSLCEDNSLKTPILHTERLELRPFTVEDAQDVFNAGRVTRMWQNICFGVAIIILRKLKAG